MIKEKEVSIKIGTCNYKHYNEKYGSYKKGDIIIVEVEDLIENSVVKITAKCDICGKEKIMKYQPYNNHIKINKKYYCDKCQNKKEKTKKTNMEKYGFDYPMQRKEVMQKSKETFLERYGIENISQREDIRKIRSIRLKDEKYQNKMSDGVFLKFGIDNVSKLQSIKDKKEQTTLTNYGVTNPSQSAFLFEKSQKSGKRIKLHQETGLYYRGTYEFDFLDFCYKNNIIVEKGPSISFDYKNKKTFYHSDYYISKYNLICEIKSDYYYEKYLELNLKKEEESKHKYNFIFIINKNYTNFLKMII